MIKVSKEEIKKLARLSALDLSEQELDLVGERLTSVLGYAQKVAEAPVLDDSTLAKNDNVFVEDTPCPTNPAPLIALAPEAQDDCFIVPAIIEKKKV